MSVTEIEKRLSAVERQVNQLARKVATSSGPASGNSNAWIDQIHGTFQNDPTYRDAARLGRAWRKSQGRRKASSRKARAK